MITCNHGFTISGLTKRPIQSGRVNLEDLGDGAGFLAALDELAGKRDLLGRQGRGAAEPNALRLRGRSAATGGRNKICSKSCAKVERIVNPRLEPA